MLEGRNSTYPSFQCPNCRAYSDLEADYDVAESDLDEWKAADGDSPSEDVAPDAGHVDGNGSADDTASIDAAMSGVPDIGDATPASNGGGLLARRAATNSGSPEARPTNGITIPARPEQEEKAHLVHLRTGTDSPTAEQIIAGEGPLTPRNNAGPFVFDGSAGRGGARRLTVPVIAESSEDRS